MERTFPFRKLIPNGPRGTPVRYTANAPQAPYCHAQCVNYVGECSKVYY